MQIARGPVIKARGQAPAPWPDAGCVEAFAHVALHRTQLHWRCLANESNTKPAPLLVMYRAAVTHGGEATPECRCRRRLEYDSTALVFETHLLRPTSGKDRQR